MSGPRVMSSGPLMRARREHILMPQGVDPYLLSQRDIPFTPVERGDGVNGISR
jgi:hypothetical protein